MNDQNHTPPGVSTTTDTPLPPASADAQAHELDAYIKAAQDSGDIIRAIALKQQKYRRHQ